MVDNFDFSQITLGHSALFDGFASITIGNVNYTGNFTNGKICGQGTATMSKQVNGITVNDIYTGNWANGRRSGTGTMTWSYGPDDYEKYSGEWKDGERHGKGRMRTRTKDVYDGEWNHNIRVM